MTTLDPDALAAELDVIEARLKNLRECDRTDLPVGKRAQFIRELNDLEASLQAVHASREWAGVVMTKQDNSESPLALFDRAIAGASGDELIEMWLRVMETAAKRATNYVEAAVDDEDASVEV
jgi:hypothetical protein